MYLCLGLLYDIRDVLYNTLEQETFPQLLGEVAPNILIIKI